MSENASTMDRNLALEAVRVTEAAALSASRWMGRGDEKAADQAAVDARPCTQGKLSGEVCANARVQDFSRRSLGRKDQVNTARSAFLSEPF